MDSSIYIDFHNKPSIYTNSNKLSWLNHVSWRETISTILYVPSPNKMRHRNSFCLTVHFTVNHCLGLENERETEKREGSQKIDFFFHQPSKHRFSCMLNTRVRQKTLRLQFKGSSEQRWTLQLQTPSIPLTWQNHSHLFWIWFTKPFVCYDEYSTHDKVYQILQEISILWSAQTDPRSTRGPKQYLRRILAFGLHAIPDFV